MPKARSQFYGRKRYYAAAAAAMPAWLAGQPINTYIDAGAGSRFSLVQTYTEPSGVSHSGIFGYCGATYINNTLYVAGSGGHGDGAANGSHSCNVAADSPAWNTLRAPSATVNQNVAHYTDDLRPSSRHTHDGIIGIDDRIFLIAGYANYGNGSFTSADVDAFNLNTNDWDPAGFWPQHADIAAGNASKPTCRDNDGNVYVWTLASNCPLYKRTKADGSWSQLSTGHSIVYTSPMAYDPVRHRLIMVDGANSKLCNLSDNSTAFITWTGAQAAVMQRGGSLFYVDALDAMLFKPNGSSTFYRVNLSTFEVTTYAIAGTPPAEAGDAVNNLAGRVGYLKNLKLVYIVTQTTTNLHGILIP